MPDAKRVALAGSEFGAPTTGSRAGPVGDDEEADLTVYLRPREGADNLDWVDDPNKPPISREELAAAAGSSDEDVAKVEAVAREHHLTVTGHDRGRRSLTVSGKVKDLAAAFGAEVAKWDDGSGTAYRIRTGTLQLPAELEGIVTGVFGFDDRPQAQPHFRTQPQAARTQYTPVQVAERYDYPPGLDGTGECVALIELGGGYNEADLDAYFKTLNLPTPSVTSVGVGSGKNSPTGSPNGPDGEVMLDIEVIGATAPGAKMVVYFAANTTQGFIDAVTTAVHDTTNKPSVISISWGGPESTWSGQSMNQMEAAFRSAAAVGVTVTVAAGDNGSTDGVNDGKHHADFPASATHALACGGTKLEADSEVVWNELANKEGATGGGISTHFGLPSYQSTAHVPVSANPGGKAGRGVPDVAGNADPTTGYTVRVDGQTMPMGGTSAVAPLWAGLIARVNQSIGIPVGFIQPVLYKNPAAFNDITSGTNGAYQAGPGWDACTGLGSPVGTKILAALKAAAPKAR